jgi:hypothetical protein
MKPPNQPLKPPGSRRLWLYRAALAVGMPIAILFALELGLRLAGYGRPATFLIPDEQAGVFQEQSRLCQPVPAGKLRPETAQLPDGRPQGAGHGPDRPARRIRGPGRSRPQLRLRPAAAGAAAGPLSRQGDRGHQHRDRGDQFPRRLPDRPRTRPFRARPLRGLHGQQRGGRALRPGLRLPFADAAALGDPGERAGALDPDRPALRRDHGGATFPARPASSPSGAGCRCSSTTR